jgi:endoglucanase
MLGWFRCFASVGSMAFVVATGCASSKGAPADPSGDSSSNSGASNGRSDNSSGSATGSSVSSSSASSSSVSSSSTSSSGGASPTGPSDAPYTIQGTTIVGASGHPHLFRGLVYPSLEWNPAGLSARNGGQSPGQTDFDVMQAWNANVVRIPLNQDFWLQDNPLSQSSYPGTVDSEVGWAENDSLDVILDLHWSDRGDPSVMQACCPSGPATNCSGDCQQVMADSRSLTFWQSVAAHYAGDPHILFELYNEPHDVTWDVWLNGTPSGQTVSGTSNDNSSTSSFAVVGMQQLYDAVNGAANGGANPNHLIIAGGLEYAYDLSGVSPTGTHVSGTNVVYATHPYQSNSTTPSDWQTHFGFLTADYPVIATEYGNRSSGQPTNCDASFDTSIIAYMDQTATGGTNPANKVSWTAWAFFNSGCAFPSLIMDTNYDPNAAGMAVQMGLPAP